MKCFICGGDIEGMPSTVRQDRLVHLFVDKCARVIRALREELERLKADKATVSKPN